MRNFNITVNGNSYVVAVEEVGEIDKAVSAPVANTPAAPTAPVSTAPSAEVSGEAVNAPMPGTVLEVKVKVGDAVKEGQVVAVLEAMKMENDIVATKTGKITSIAVKKGDTVNSNDLLVTIG